MASIPPPPTAPGHAAAAADAPPTSQVLGWQASDQPSLEKYGSKPVLLQTGPRRTMSCPGDMSPSGSTRSYLKRQFYLQLWGRSWTIRDHQKWFEETGRGLGTITKEKLEDETNMAIIKQEALLYRKELRRKKRETGINWIDETLPGNETDTEMCAVHNAEGKTTA